MDSVSYSRFSGSALSRKAALARLARSEMPCSALEARTSLRISLLMPCMYTASETPPKQTSAMRSSFSRIDSIHGGGGFDALRLVAPMLEGRQDGVGMAAVVRLHRNVEARALGRDVEKQPLVIDLENVGAELAKPRRDVAEHAGAIRNGETERHDAIVALELAHHDGGEDARIDIAAAQDETDPAAAETFRLRP